MDSAKQLVTTDAPSPKRTLAESLCNVNLDHVKPVFPFEDISEESVQFSRIKLGRLVDVVLHHNEHTST